ATQQYSNCAVSKRVAGGKQTDDIDWAASDGGDREQVLMRRRWQPLKRIGGRDGSRHRAPRSAARLAGSSINVGCWRSGWREDLAAAVTGWVASDAFIVSPTVSLIGRSVGYLKQGEPSARGGITPMGDRDRDG